MYLNKVEDQNQLISGSFQRSFNSANSFLFTRCPGPISIFPVWTTGPSCCVQGTVHFHQPEELTDNR